MINVVAYADVEEFLQTAGAELESREALNGLMLGVCGQLKLHPERFQHPVCLKIVEEDGVPILEAIMTPPQRLLISGQPDNPEVCAVKLTDSLMNEGWKIPGVSGPGEIAASVTGRLADASGRRFRLEENLRLYELKTVELPIPSSGRLRTATAVDLECISRWWVAARMEMFGKSDPEADLQTATWRIGDGDVFVWEDGEPVSMACKTRPTKRGISIGMVFTPPPHRRRGYATACVGALSRKLLQEGREFCSLYADLANPTSNSIYQKIGYRPIGDFRNYELIEAA